MRLSSIVCGTVLAIFLTGTFGCGSGNEIQRYDISGTVTHNGKPVPMGEISFEAVTGKVGGGFAPITNGKFNTSVDGRGHLGGEHSVQIVGFSGWVDESNPDRGAIPLFSPYKTTVTLEESTSEIDFEVP